MATRKFKFHEQKLLKKVNFMEYRKENNVREIKILRKYHIQKREDYTKYNKLCGSIKKVTEMISKLDLKDPFRKEITDTLLEKLFAMGVINDKSSITACDKITASAFARRRLSVVLVKLKMAETLKEAVTFVEQGHIRLGPELVQDPAMHVTRTAEDLVTWVDNSAIKRQILKYNDRADDFDLL